MWLQPAAHALWHMVSWLNCCMQLALALSSGKVYRQCDWQIHTFTNYYIRCILYIRCIMYIILYYIILYYIILYYIILYYIILYYIILYYIILYYIILYYVSLQNMHGLLELYQQRASLFF